VLAGAPAAASRRRCGSAGVAGKSSSEESQEWTLPFSWRPSRSEHEMTMPADVGYTVPPEITSHLKLQSLPDAACTIRAMDGDGSSPSLLVYSDPDGFIDLHVRPSNEHDQPGRLVIEAVAEGQTARHALTLRSALQPTADMPAPPPRVTRQPDVASIRPALDLDEALRLGEAELVGRGYPLRPDPAAAPEAFDGWRRSVSSELAFVEPRVVARPDAGHPGRLAGSGGPATSGNWSGFELRGEAGTFDWVNGQWIVPTVTGENFTETWSAFWIGLDGDGLSDLVQCGTEQNNITIDFLFWNISVSSYYAWTEFLPQQSTEQQITNFTVSPGDQMFAEMWIGNAGSAPTLSGFFGVFLIENWTSGYYTWVYTPVGTTKVVGSEAEWIMERPKVGDALSDLANYEMANMFSAVARRTNGQYVAYQGATNEQLTMINGPDTLSTVAPVDSLAMEFMWHAFH
jgi:hypothetical protein